MRRSGNLIVLSIVAACALVFAGSAAAAGIPEVDYLPATQVTSTGATLEVGINPEGSDTSYEIFLECQSATRQPEHCEPLTVDPQRQTGLLAASSEGQDVTAPVSGLQPDYLYDYGVLATNAAGHNGFIHGGFVTCPTPPSPCPSQSYWPDISIPLIESAEREAAEAFRLENERVAAKRAAEERAAKEAAEREREIREAGERAEREQTERWRRACVVPRLEGDSPPQAARALGEAHCSLGKLTKPNGDHGPLVVVRQSVPRGRRLAPGSRVAVTLASREAAGHHSS